MSKIKKIVNNLEPLAPRENLIKILNNFFILSQIQKLKLNEFLNIVEKNNTKNNFDYSFLRENSIVFLLEVMKDEDLNILQDVDTILNYLNEDEIKKWKDNNKEFINLPINQAKTLTDYESEILSLFKIENLTLKYSNVELEKFIFGSSFTRKFVFLKLLISSYIKKRDWKKEYINQSLQEDICGNFNFFLKNWINEILNNQLSLYIIPPKNEVEVNETFKFYLEMYLFAESKKYIDSIKYEIKNDIHCIANEIAKENGLIIVQEMVREIVNKYKFSYQEDMLSKL